MRRPVFAWCAAALLGTTLLLNLTYVARCGDGLSPFADPYSEACVLRAGERFARDGYLATYGLADPTFGGKYPGMGIEGPSGSRPDDPIYQGYPPGPEWLGGLYTRWIGPGRVGVFRAFPVALATAAAATFLAGLAGAVGRWRALWVYLACLLTPMFTGMSHGLYYQGYALSLLLIQAALVMRAFGPGGAGRLGPWALLALFALGFLQGWLSFDYCFLVAFAAVPLALTVMPWGGPLPWRGVVTACAAAGLGFTVAHGLHFAQSVLYMGGLQPALDEFAFRSKKQYGVKALLEGRSRAEVLAIGLRLYLRAYLRWNHLFSVPGEVLLGALAVALAVTRLELAAGPWRFEAVLRRSGARELAALAVALLVGLGWLFAKPAHALNHLSSIGRHLFLFYLTGCLIVARATSVMPARPPAGEAPDTRDEAG